MPIAKYELKCQLSAHHLMQVITDFESYSEFLPEVQSTVVQQKGPPVWEVSFELQLIRPLKYRLRLEQKSDYEIEWSLIDGFFTSNKGRWLLTPEQDHTIVVYEIEMHLHQFLPRSISNSLTKRSLPATVERFVEEAKKRLAMQVVLQKNVQDDN